MLIINLFGASGVGKSTTASGLFYWMKTNGYSVELVTEYAKDLVWADRAKCLQNQIKVTSVQYGRQLSKMDQVDYIITDSPLLLGTIYAPKNYFEHFEPLVFEMFDSFDNVNVLLKRTKEFVNIGRNETEEESNRIALDVECMLRDNNVNFKTLNADRDVVAAVVSHLKARNVI